MDQCAHPVCGPAVEPTGYLAELRAILDRKALTPHFQPILDLRIGELYGFEGLIRGPSDSILHAPLNLLGAARQGGLLPELSGPASRPSWVPGPRRPSTTGSSST